MLLPSLKMPKAQLEFTTEDWTRMYWENEKRDQRYFSSLKDRYGDRYDAEVKNANKCQYDSRKVNPMKGKTFVVDEECQPSESCVCSHQVKLVKLKWWAKECHTEITRMSGYDIAKLFQKENITVPDHFKTNGNQESNQMCTCFG